MAELLLVEDHPVFRVGLKLVIEQLTDVRVVAEAGNGQEAVDMVDHQPVDLVLMDMNMPVMDGLKATKLIKEKHPNVKVLMYSADEDNQVIVSAIRAGIDGYVFKSEHPTELKMAIESVMKNEHFLSRNISKSLLPLLVEEKKEDANIDEHVKLSAREKEILKLILEGHSNKKIGEQLFLSIRTVSTHRYNLMKKLHCSNIAQLFKCAMEKGLL